MIYELHVRDFSAFDESVPAEYRGTFKAFTVPDSNGMKHLEALAQAGLTHIHLLPVFDIASIDENKANWVQPDVAKLQSLPPDSSEQQAPAGAESRSGWLQLGLRSLPLHRPRGQLLPRTRMAPPASWSSARWSRP